MLNEFDAWLAKRIDENTLGATLLNILNIAVKKVIIEEKAVSPLDIPRTLDAIKKMVSLII